MTSKLKISGNVRELTDCLTKLCQIIPTAKGGARPYLANVQLRAENGVFEMLGTDQDISLRLRPANVEVKSDGIAVANAAKLLQILKEFSGETIDIEEDQKVGIRLGLGMARYHVFGDDPADYPELPTACFDGALALPAKDLMYMISRTAFAAGEENTRYGRKGILIEAKDGKLRLVATDAKRLTLCEKPFAEQLPQPISAIIATGGLTLLKSVVSEDETNVLVSIGDSLAHFRTTKGAVLTARRIEGNFPPYEKVTTFELPYKLDIDRKEFLLALKRSMPLIGRDGGAIKFQFDRDGLLLTSRALDAGEGVVRFAFPNPHPEMTVGFNPVFFQDLFKLVSDAKIRFEYKDGQHPVMLKELEGAENMTAVPGFMYVIMPMDIA